MTWLFYDKIDNGILGRVFWADLFTGDQKGSLRFGSAVSWPIEPSIFQAGFAPAEI